MKLRPASGDVLIVEPDPSPEPEPEPDGEDEQCIVVFSYVSSSGRVVYFNQENIGAPNDRALYVKNRG